MEDTNKRKTHTSTEVKKRYNQKTYTQIIVSVKKEIAAEYKEKCDNAGIPYSKPLHEAILKFIEEN